MPNHAHITIVGHLGRDPELKKTPQDMSVCKFSVAVGTGYGDRKVTTWWTVTLFGKQADNAAKFLRKGDPVLIEGEPHLREYDKKDGSGKGVSAEITANKFALIGSKREASEKATGDGCTAVCDGEIPF